MMRCYWMLAKFRRHILHPILNRFHFTEVLQLIGVAFCLALIYTFVVGSQVNESEVVSENVNFIDHSPVQREERDLPVGLEAFRDFTAAVLVICAARPNAIDNHLQLLLKHRPSDSAFPIVVSQDGNNREVIGVVEKFVALKRNITHFQHPTKRTRVVAASGKNYPFISEHYKWALHKVFVELGYQYVIVTEDDLEISPDFFSYFRWGQRLLETDPTVWCVSAWNDNGVPNAIDSTKPELLWRTDFFPGLGWILKKELFLELEKDWPKAYWDDWMRSADIRKNRSCVRPEISRTAHNMRLAGKGSSGGLYKKIINDIKFSEKKVDFSLIPVEDMVKERYDKALSETLLEAKTIELTSNTVDLLDTKEWDPSYSYKIIFDNVRTWYNIGTKLGLMLDIRGGMMRTAYCGIVTAIFNKCRVYVIPKQLDIHNIQSFAYNSTWDLQLRYLEFAKIYCRPGKFTGDCDPDSEAMKRYFSGNKSKFQRWLPLVRV